MDTTFIPARVLDYLGADHVAWLRSDGDERAAVHAEGRAAGAWDANNVESYAAYRVLAAALRAGPGFAGVHPGGWGAAWSRWALAAAEDVARASVLA